MLKVLQYNIYFGEDVCDIDFRLHNVCSCILNTEADVVCMQEVLSTKYDMINYYIDHVYKYRYPDTIDHRYGTAIFSKYPLNKTQTIKYDFTRMNRDLKIALINDIYVGVTHFESEFGYNIGNKLYQYKLCSDIMKSYSPSIICMDSNICTKSAMIFNNVFHKNGTWRDSWIITGCDKKNEITFDSYTNPILLDIYSKNPDTYRYRSRLDRVLYIGDIRAKSIKLIGTDKTDNDNCQESKQVIMLSDHYGVLVEF